MLNFDVSILKELLSSAPLVKSVTELHQRRLSEPWAKGRSVCRGYELEIELNGISTTVYFGVKNSFPLSLPKIFLAQWDIFDILPHVETDGFVCYAQEEGLALDYENIAGIVQEALSSAMQVVLDGIAGKNIQDFKDEFGSYWERQKSIKDFRSIVVPGDQVKQIHLYKGKDSLRILSDDEQSFKKHLKLPPHDSWKHYPAIYIPLKPGTIIVPPHPSRLWDISYIRKILFENLTADNISRLLSFIKKPHPEEVLLVSLPRTSEGETLFGIKLSSAKYHEHPLIDGETASGVVPISITRRDKEYLLPRGGSNLVLRNKRVLLLGCGSVGGHIANELTRAGILHLTVLDKEVLAPENYFRHVFGKKSVGKAKVGEIKKDIEERLPYVEVTPVYSPLEDAIASGKIKVNDYDLIISALGNVTIELAFNKLIHKTEAPPVIFTWLEPYGIGGHALLTNLNSTSQGCFKCLYQFENGALSCRASFAENGQSFSKNIDGCRGAFTPFGSLDAMKTAEMATRLAIATLNGGIKSNLIRSWRGDAGEFLKNGKILSSRYTTSNAHYIEASDYHIGDFPDCPICHEHKR